ncbi:hypothetical protein [Algoriphagus litoralis]|uniref:hypothetical protein n=1 Tax=Algoriphagus litoralis TaxID=2202829 RepID=UPI000DBA885D|nr:hypothetical protein [Algoriphagus litoralis]
MENDSIEELQSLLTEEIYLIPQDREDILRQLAEAEVSPTRPVQAEPILDPIAVRGNFSKGILVLHEEPTLNPEVMEMLVNMIKAVGHSMNEVGMVSSARLENRSMEEFQALNAHVVLKFGVIKHPVNALFDQSYEVHAIDETEYLFADSLSSIFEDKKLKVKLWNSLQILFNLSTNKK